MYRLSIYGSCVSRDTFEFLGPGFELSTYVARQSLISATTPAIELPGELELTSNFQRRAVSDDFASRAVVRLRGKIKETDLLLLDLVDERLGVLSWPGSRWVTRSSELKHSGVLGSLSHRPVHVAFGTSRHLQLWSVALQRFTHRLRHAGLLDRVVVVRAPWADVTVQGDALPSFAGHTIAEVNAMFERYYALLENLGYRSIELPSELAVSDREHRWTAAPYHYQKPAYEYLAQEIRRVAEILPDSRQRDRS
ncbi:hypothetical protein GCM10011374_29510 [Kocuria dechangensis]|uniref:Uncharacterized protein n=1 Tax=Kocuria dechangensis TaxID=1176249 RepID=A0A917LXQ8_9MICC|nr:DUF6270 domain-containing protein [Kocuria dechangensis]GGG64061.1 hypothetical protein GCM10011374_29510 [Kocuria dechangensis]